MGLESVGAVLWFCYQNREKARILLKIQAPNPRHGLFLCVAVGAIPGGAPETLLL